MNNVTEIVLLVVLVVLVVALFAISYFKKKKYNTELGTMRSELKVGDKVMTDTGVIGEVVNSFEEEGYKYFVLKTGDDKHVGYFTVHANAIYYVFGKEEQTSNKVNDATSQPTEENAEENAVVEQPVSAEKKPVNKNSKSTKK